MMKRQPQVISILIAFFGLALSSYAAVPAVRSWYNLTGFGNATTGGGVIATNNPAYRQVTNDLDFANAIASARNTAGSVSVIEIMNDLNLGWNEISAAAKTASSSQFRSHNGARRHPVLITSGVSIIDIQPRSGLTIFSANGSTIRHAMFNIKNCTNIVVRNLKFDEMWEWDEDSPPPGVPGNYDVNDWDFIDLGNGGTTFSNGWVDHCTFTKAYDGAADFKGGTHHITFSWCKYVGDDGGTNPNSFVWQQINALETTVSNPNTNKMYYFLRHTGGFSTTDIVTIVQGHDKTHLIGSSNFNVDNTNFAVTLHHQLFSNTWDRLPRLRSGNVHDYNIYVEDTLALAAKRLRDSHPSTNAYSFNPPVNGSISTEDGAVLVEKSVYIDNLSCLRNNQTAPSQPRYTGKIMALDTIYHFDNADTTTIDFRGDSTNAPGSTYFGPAQAPVVPFSWNLPGNQLPYTYTMHDPSQLKDILTSPTAGAGAGVLTWDKTNWLATAYPGTAPIIDADPQSQSVTNGQSVTLNVTAYGSLPLWYKWYFNTNSPVTGGTNMSLTIPSVQSSDLGDYSVVVSNNVGTVTSAFATLSLYTPPTPFQVWQTQYFPNCTNCPQADAAADPDGDGQNNMAEFLSGSDPTNNFSVLRITSAVPQGTNVVITWTTVGGKTNAVQAASGDADGGYTTNFIDITTPPHLIIPGSGDATNNYTDEGGANSSPSRFYRIRLVP